jgi:uncharacterized protein (TIGR02996 family)
MPTAFTDEDRLFLRAIQANPAELTAWLVYADWLDEHDDPRAEFIRLEVRRLDPNTSQTERFGITGRLEDVRANLDPDWVAIFDRPRIENCDERFAFQCPKQWDQLRGTADPLVRHCDACEKNVYYCHSVGDAYDHARQGHCVAVAEGLPRRPGDLDRNPEERRELEMFVGIIRMPDSGEQEALSGEHEPLPPPPPPARRPWWKFW